MFNTKGLMSSKKMDWRTPENVIHWCEGIYGEPLFDPCPENPDFDGLEIEWRDLNFVNPPYGTEIGYWLKKGFEEFKKGKLVIFLVPSRTDTRWWHDYCMKAQEIFLIKGRLKFEGYDKGTAPFPSCLVIFDPSKKDKRLEVNALEFKKEINSL